MRRIHTLIRLYLNEDNHNEKFNQYFNKLYESILKFKDGIIDDKKYANALDKYNETKFAFTDNIEMIAEQNGYKYLKPSSKL